MTKIQDFYRAETFRVEESVGYLIRRIAHAVGRELDRRMAELGLTDAQWKPLLLLQLGVCSTAADISRIACHDNGAVTRLLDRLEGKGLIERLRSEADRRVVKLELTDEGARVATSMISTISSFGTGLSRKPRIDRRPRTTSS